MRVEQNNQYQDFFDRQNKFFEDMHTHSKAYKQGIEDLKVQQHKYVDELKAGQEITNKVVLELKKNQDKHQKELAAHRKEYKEHNKPMKEGIQQINPYLKARLPEDIPEWMQGNVQAGRGRFSDGMSPIPRNCLPGASSASMNKDDKGKGKAEKEDGDERGKKKAFEASVWNVTNVALHEQHFKKLARTLC
ncbi:hypothetical protein PIB30_101770, partial [Stylosanthes scabra]|nr:hypothetical protein [Stylosanthes scabra]